MEHPILRYYGAKWRQYPKMEKYIPKHEAFYETHFGSGSFYFRKDKVKANYLNDLSAEVYNFFQVLRDKPGALTRVIKFTPWHVDEAKESFKPAKTKLERARRFFVKTHMNVGNYSCFRFSRGSDATPQKITLMDIEAFALHLAGSVFDRLDAVDFLVKYDPCVNGKKSFVYIDPPYPKQTRSKSHRNDYDHEYEHDCHVRLLDHVVKLKCNVMISTYENELYDEKLKGWVKKEYDAQTFTSKPQKEVLYMNYQIEPSIFDILE